MCPAYKSSATVVAAYIYWLYALAIDKTDIGPTSDEHKIAQCNHLILTLGTYRYSDTGYSDTHYSDTFASFARGQCNGENNEINFKRLTLTLTLTLIENITV